MEKCLCEICIDGDILMIWKFRNRKCKCLYDYGEDCVLMILKLIVIIVNYNIVLIEERFE